MNNKESKSYKDMYHFTGNYYPVDKSELSSIESDPSINTTIKENPYRSNVEIEGDEIVLQPDFSALFKAKGKKHSQGGMDVLLKPDSFVFSNDKSLALDKKDCAMFEFDMGGMYKNKDKKYTPAEVLKKNVDIKHYNTLTSNLEDVKKDDIAKKSSLMMLEKYFKTIGNVAFVQEAKKGFPDGVPDFAKDTAPVYNTDVKAEINSQKQYAKYGGSVKNPYMQLGGMEIGEPYWTLKEVNRVRPYGKNASQKEKDKYIYNDVMGKWYEKIYLDNQGNPAEGAAKTLGNVTVRNRPLSGVPPKESGVPPINTTPFVNYRNIPKLNGLPVSTPGNEVLYKDVPDKILPGDVTGQQQTGKEIDWQFTPWQKLSMGYDAYKYASAKRYMPYRSRFNPSYIDPALLNPEQTIGDLKGAAYQQSQAVNSLSPILRNAQQSSIYGQLLNQVPGVRSQYDNQNVGILNQARQYNNQVRNNAQAMNMQNDQQYYQQSVAGQQNFDNMKSFLADRFMNNLTRNVEDNQSLALQLLAQGPNPAYGYDFKRDRFTRNPQNILDIQTSPQADVVSQLLGKLLPQFETLDPRTQVAVTKMAIAKGLPLPQGYGNYYGNQKKGGMLKRNPYN